MPAGARPTTLGHVHPKVGDLDRSLAFYRDAIGLDVAERHGTFAVLSVGEHHHDLALQAVGADATGPGPEPSVGRYHAAFEVPSAAALSAVYERLEAHDVLVSPSTTASARHCASTTPTGTG